jgi:purine catabolism regulator
MRTTIKDLLRSSAFYDSQVVAGENGLLNKVSTVNVIDAPSGLRYVKKGTLIITSGYEWLTNKDTQSELIHRMVELGASGLALKPHLFGNLLPENINDAANKLSFPVFFLSDRLAYADFIAFFQNNFFCRTTGQFLSTERIYEEIFQAIEQDDWNSVGKILLDCTGRSLLIQNRCSTIHFGPKNISEVVMNIKKENPIPMIAGKYDTWKVASFEAQIGEQEILLLGCKSTEDALIPYALYVLEDGEPFTNQELLLINLTVRAIKSTNTVNTKKSILLQEALISDLLTNEHKEVDNELNQLKRLNKTLSQKYAVAAFSLPVKHDDFPQVNYEVEKIFSSTISIDKILLGNYQNRFVILVPAALSDKHIKPILSVLPNILHKKIEAGIGEVMNIGKVIKSYEQALRALFWAKLHNSKNVFHYNDLGLLRLLSTNITKEEIQSFCSSYLSKIETYDKEYNTELLLTLETHINNFWNYTATAKVLHLDPNTIRYRINKITAIGGVDLQNAYDRLNIENALMLKDFL